MVGCSDFLFTMMIVDTCVFLDKNLGLQKWKTFPTSRL